jgi:hypothetical protein
MFKRTPGRSNWAALSLLFMSLLLILSVHMGPEKFSAAVSDLWAIPSTSGGATDSWHVPGTGTYANGFLPGTTDVNDIGSPSALVHRVHYSRVKTAYTAVSASTTLTVESAYLIAVTNATAVITLQNATTAGAGYHQRVVNAANAGNVSVASASNISGAASLNVTASTGASFVSDGTTWFKE